MKVTTKNTSKTKSTTQTKAKSPTRKTKNPANKVWHVFRFRERFELADDQRFCRKGPIIYARDYVTPADDESCLYLEQIATLRRERDGLELEGAWSRLRAMASRRSRAYRGFLLNERFEPATTSELARTVLYVTPKRAEKILRTLEAIGLIERLDVPDWDLTLNDIPKKKKASRSKKEGKNSKAKSRKTTRNLERARETTSATERRRAPLRAENESRIEKEREEKNNPSRVKDNTNASALKTKDEGQAETRTTPPPAATPGPDPIDPTLPDASEGAKVIPFAQAPSGSVTHTRGDPQQIGDILTAKAHRYDAEAIAFGDAIFGELGLDRTLSRDSTEGRSEVCCFASEFRKLTAGLPSAAVVTIKNKALVHASQVRKNAKRCRSPSAVWLSKFQGLCIKYSDQREKGAG